MPSMTRLSGLGVAALSLFSSVGASKHGAAGHVEKRQNSAAIVGPSGSVQPRLEIRQLEQNADQWNLFMLAMQAFQNTNHNDVMSWYQLAGIHGMPYQPWNGVSGQNSGTGYCPHSSPLFACWHRPYVVAWEQAMLDNAQSVVNQFSGADKTRYQNALQSLRHPYWDWAEVPPSGNSADAMPQSMSNQTVTVNTPSGQQQIPNPLYSFTKMNPHSQSDFSGVGGGDWDGWSSTLRYPSSADAGAASSDASAVQALGNYNAQARAQVYRVLTACTSFLDISNDGVAEQNSNCGVSLESIHNGIHTFTGGQNQPGHMTYNNFAAFDPAFFLHHANVDRLLSLWQALHPNDYMPASNQGSSATYTINANSAVDANTPLEPFHGANGQAHTCNSVRDTTVFKYTYPEIQAGNVAQAVNSLYGSNAVPQKLSSSSSSSSASATSSSASRSSSASSSASATGSSSSRGSSSASASGSRSSSASGSSASASNSGSASGRASSSTVPLTNSRGQTTGSSVASVSASGASGSGSGSGSASASVVSFTNSAGSVTATSTAAGASGSASGSVVSLTNSAGSVTATSTVAGAGGSGPASGSVVSLTDSAGSATGTSTAAGASGTRVGGGLGGMASSVLSGAASIIGGAGSIIGGQQVSNGATTAPSSVALTPTGTGSGLATGSASALFPSVTGSFPQLGNSNSSNSSIPTNLPSLLTPQGRTHDYTCHVVSEKHGLGGTYTVFGFLGNEDVPDSPDQWLSHPDFCGAHSVFAPLGVPTSNQMLVGGQISLTTSLVGKIASGDLKSLDESDVLPYLANNLSWKVATAAGKPVDNSQVPGLTVGAVSQKIMPAANADSLPTYGNGNVCQNATHGKSGGVQTGMQYDWWNACSAQAQSS